MDVRMDVGAMMRMLWVGVRGKRATHAVGFEQHTFDALEILGLGSQYCCRAPSDVGGAQQRMP